MYNEKQSLTKTLEIKGKIRTFVKNSVIIISASSFSTISSAAAVLPASPLFSQPELFNSSPSVDFNSEITNSEITPTMILNLQTIQEMIRTAINDLKAGKKNEGLKKLEQAWGLNPAIPVAGVVIATTHLQAREYKEALTTALKIQNNSPKVAEGYLLAGIAYAGLGNQNQVKSAFEKALQIQPGNPNAATNLAGFYLKQGQIEKAREILTQALSINPNHFQLTKALTNLELQDKHLENAVSLMDSAIKQHPEKIDPYVILSQIYLTHGQVTKALNLLKTALKRFPNQIELMQHTAVVFLQNNAPGQAIHLLNKAIELSPDKASLHYNLALCYEQIKQYTPALAEVKKALQIDPEHSSSKFIYARLMAETGHLDEAQKLIKALEKSNPESANIPELKGRIAAAQNNLDEAINYYKNAVKQTNDTPPPQLIAKLAITQFKAGNEHAGYETLKNWINQHPTDISLRYVLADRLLDTGRFPEAQKYYLEILEIQPNSIIASNNLAWLLSETGQDKKALIQAEKNYIQYPQTPFIIDTLATILMKKGEIERATELLRKAKKISPENNTISFHLAKALTGINNSEAITILNSLLSKEIPLKDKQSYEKLLRKIKGHSDQNN